MFLLIFVSLVLVKVPTRCLARGGDVFQNYIFGWMNQNKANVILALSPLTLLISSVHLFIPVSYDQRFENTTWLTVFLSVLEVMHSPTISTVRSVWEML